MVRERISANIRAKYLYFTAGKRISLQFGHVLSKISPALPYSNQNRKRTWSTTKTMGILKPAISPVLEVKKKKKKTLTFHKKWIFCLTSTNIRTLPSSSCSLKNLLLLTQYIFSRNLCSFFHCQRPSKAFDWWHGCIVIISHTEGTTGSAIKHTTFNSSKPKLCYEFREENCVCYAILFTLHIYHLRNQMKFAHANIAELWYLIFMTEKARFSTSSGHRTTKFVTSKWLFGLWHRLRRLQSGLL